MSFALSDIVGKLDQIDEHTKESGDDGPGLLAIVSKEVELNVHDTGKSSPSITRTLLRLMWFLDFVAKLLHILGEKQDSAVSSAAREAYSETLATHHPWLVRKAASASMSLCPSRTTFMEKIGLVSLEESDRGNILRTTASMMHRTLSGLWQYYEEKKLTKLK